jgi:hypothetical protein
MFILLSNGSSAFFSNIGAILSGLAELLVALGAGIGFIIRTRRGARRERLRAETAASLAAQETKKTLEEKLDKQYTAQLDQYKISMKQQIDQANAAALAIEQSHTIQVAQLQAQIKDLQAVNSHLLERILEDHHE